MSILSNIDIKPLTHIELMNREFINWGDGVVYERDMYPRSRKYRLHMRYDADIQEFSWWVEVRVDKFSYTNPNATYIGRNGYTKLKNITTTQDLDMILSTVRSKAIQVLADNDPVYTGLDDDYFCK